MACTVKFALAFSLSFFLFCFPRVAEAIDLELTELLEALKAQMKLLEETGRKDPMWQVKEAKLRAQFVLVKKGEAGLKAIVTVGGEYSKEAVQEITLDLTPLRHMKIEAPESERGKQYAVEVKESLQKVEKAAKRAEAAATRAEQATKRVEGWIMKSEDPRVTPR